MRRLGVHVLVWILLLAAGAVGGWVVRGHGAAEAERQLASGAQHVQAALDDTAPLMEGLQSAQEDAADVQADVLGAVQGVSDAVESTEELQVVVQHMQEHEAQQGDTLAALETELRGLAAYGQPIYPHDLEAALELVADLRQQHDQQAATIQHLQDRVAGLETSLRATMGDLAAAHDNAQHLDVALSVSEQHVTEVRDQLQQAADDLRSAQDQLAAAGRVPIWVGLGAAAAGVAVGFVVWGLP